MEFKSRSGWQKSTLVSENKLTKKLVENQVKVSVKKFEHDLACKAKENPKLINMSQLVQFTINELLLVILSSIEKIAFFWYASFCNKGFYSIYERG